MDLSTAFPARFADDVRAVVAIMPAARLWCDELLTVDVDGESVSFPYRIYHDEPAPAAKAGLTPTQRLLLDCLYTRNHNGWVRQRRLAAVLGSREPFVAPFVVQLAGEYVLEIVRTVADWRPYADFAARNPAFVKRTMVRAISYWNEYYRRGYQGYRDYHDYPGYSAVAGLLDRLNAPSPERR
jgi:hypothetical protein